MCKWNLTSSSFLSTERMDLLCQVWCRHSFFAHRPFCGVLSQALFPIYSHIANLLRSGAVSSMYQFICTFNKHWMSPCVQYSLSTAGDTVVTQIGCVFYPHLPIQASRENRHLSDDHMNKSNYRTVRIQCYECIFQCTWRGLDFPVK